MDGVIAADPAWETIPIATGFAKLGNGYAEPKQTSVQVCWDAEALHIGMTCEEPDVASLKPTVRDGGDTWLDDGVEIFLQPTPDGTVTQFVVTAAAARGGYEGAPDFLRYQAAAHTGADFYSLEIRIPFELLHATPAVGDTWRGGFCRNTWVTQSGGDKFTSWPPLQARFLEPERFATISFLGPAPDPAQAARASEQLNRAYRAELTRRLRAVAAQGSEYRPTLIEASQDAGFRERAETLLRRWGELDTVLQLASQASVQDVRGLLKSADALKQESYEVKYAYLIAKVLGD